jgi:hypothetical protein
MVSFLPFVREGFTDLSKAGVMGDFFGGYVGTFFSLASVALLLSTFRSQQRATAQQNFESKYFELLKMHRDNVSEFELSGIQGRKVFVPIVREFQAILLQIRRFARTHDYTAEITQSDFVVISYYALFFGVGPNSSRMFRSALKSYGPIFATALDGYLSRDDVQNEIKNHAEISYKPVDGHQSRLGHYYRHLYQTVTYVDDSPFIGNRYGYVKTIRAQLTNYEQALFLVNSFSPMGRAWWDRDLVVKYNLVKNIPRGFFDKSLDVVIEQLFGSEANFEWQEYEDESLK